LLWLDVKRLDEHAATSRPRSDAYGLLKKENKEEKKQDQEDKDFNFFLNKEITS